MHRSPLALLATIVGALILPMTLASPAAADLWGTSVDFNMTAPMGTEELYDRVYRFDTAGNKIASDIPHASAGLSLPSGIAVSPAGNIYVSSIAIGSILVFDGQTGAPVSINGGPAGFFTTLGAAAPAQLAFGPDGNLYVSEFFGTAVRVFDPQTAMQLEEKEVTGLTSAGGLAFGPDGDLYIGDGFVMSPEDSARVVRVHEGVASTFGDTGSGSLSSPTALEFLPNGNLLVVDLLGNYIAQFDSAGNAMLPFAFPVGPAIPDPLPDGVVVPSNNPSDIDYDQDGNLIVSLLGLTNPPDHRGALLRFELDGTPLAPLAENLEPIGSIAWTPSASTLAGDYDGNLLVELADYTKWQSDFAKRVARGNGADGNNNGYIDAADYTVWRDALGNNLGSGAVAVPRLTVPEPSSLLVAALCLLSLAGVRMSRRGGVRRV